MFSEVKSFRAAIQVLTIKIVFPLIILFLIKNYVKGQIKGWQTLLF